MNVQTFLVQESIQTRWRLGSSTTYLVFKAASSHSENPLEKKNLIKSPFCTVSQREICDGWIMGHGKKSETIAAAFSFWLTEKNVVSSS